MLKKLLTTLLCVLLCILVVPTNQLNADTFVTTFNADGGTFGEDETIDVVVDSETKVIGESDWPSDPVKTGYSFDGYSVDGEKITKDYVFEEDDVVKALWTPKHTIITLNTFDGNEGDLVCEAIFDAEMPKIQVPNKKDADFIGYFDQDGNQYYDAEGNSLKNWDKDVEQYELIAGYQEIIVPEMLLGDPAMYTVSIDLDGGTIIGNAPEGWTLTDSKYTKEFANDSYYYDIIEDWNSIVIDKEGFVANTASNWNRSPWWYYLTGNSTITVSYQEAIAISIVSPLDHATVISNVGKMAKGSWVYFEDNCITDGWGKKYVEISPEEGYAVDYWLLDGEVQTSSKYVSNNFTVEPHLAVSCGLKVMNKLVTVDNKSDIFGDGTCSYNSDTKVLTVSNEDSKLYMYGGIQAEDDLTVNLLCEAYIGNGYVENFYGFSGNFGIVCNGTLTINAEKSIEVIAYGSNSTAIHAKDIIINKGDITARSDGFTIYAENSITIDSENEPKLTLTSSNTSALMSSSMDIDGAHVYGAVEEYVPGITTSLYQQHPNTPIVITYTSLSTQYNLWVGDTRITDENKNSSSKYSYDPVTNTLTLKDSINGANGSGIYCLDDLIIKVGSEDTAEFTIKSGQQSLTGETYGIYCAGDLIIESDYKDTNLIVKAGTAKLRSVGLFCDGKLTIKSKVVASSDVVNNTIDGFAISAGTWARSGIAVEGEKEKLYLDSTGNTVRYGDYPIYGILCGDGNPGFDKEATMSINGASVMGKINNNSMTCSSAYGIYSYGSINLNGGSASASIDNYISEDSSVLYCGDDMTLTNGAEVNIEDLAFYDEGLAIKGVEVVGTLTVDDSIIDVLPINEYESASLKLKKYQGIYVKNLVVKGESTEVYSYSLPTVSGDTSAIYVQQKIDIENGVVIAVGANAGGNSYGIYAGRDSFEGKHTIKNGLITAIAEETGDGESVALRTKKGELEITGGTIGLYAEDNGLNSSDVITINRIDYEVYPEIVVDVPDGNAAIKSKEVLVLNDAIVLGTTNVYDPSSTCELIGTAESTVEIYFRRLAQISGIFMDFPEGQSSYVYGETVGYFGEPYAYDVYSETDVEEGMILESDYEYKYYVLYGEEYVPLSYTPKDAGSYKLVISVRNNHYEGTTELPFEIEKKVITNKYGSLLFEYCGIEMQPYLFVSEMAYNDCLYYNTDIYKIYNSKGELIPVPSASGSYTIEATINEGDFFVQDEDTFDDVTSNYDVSGIIGTFTAPYCISNTVEYDNNVITAAVNNSSKVLDTYMKKITVEEAKEIFSDESNENNAIFLEAINNDEEVLIFAEVNDVSGENKFASKGLNDSNSIQLDIRLYAQTQDGFKVALYNTGEVLTRLGITVSNNNAKKIIGNNKNYYVYRIHEDSIRKLDCSVSMNVNDYVFTFRTNKFSNYAIFSEDKPVIHYADYYEYRRVPNTIIHR